MKTKRKSLGEAVWDICFSRACCCWDSVSDSERSYARSIASRIRREVLKRELEKAEKAFGVRAIHGERVKRARVMLESRRREKAQACIVRDVATGCVASGATQAEATAALVKAMNPDRSYKEVK